MPVSSANALEKRPFRLAAHDRLFPRGSWFAGQSLSNHFLNAYTLLIPEGERFIIRSCRRHLDRTDAELRNELSGLFYQESGQPLMHFVPAQPTCCR